MPRNDTSIEPPKMTGFGERWVAEHIYMLGGGALCPLPTPPLILAVSFIWLFICLVSNKPVNVSQALS